MLPLLILLSCVLTIMGFAPPTTHSTLTHHSSIHRYPPTVRNAEGGVTSRTSDVEQHDPNETVARRIIVTGDVNGGYYRTCVINEARRFRKLNGTMSPPDGGGDRAEIYVEGKRKMIESFVRWCKRGDVGLSQSVKVGDVVEEFPTGLYDDFYCDTGRKKD